MRLCSVKLGKIHRQQFFRKKTVFLERIFCVKYFPPAIQCAGQKGQKRRYAQGKCDQRPENTGAALAGLAVYRKKRSDK